MRIFLKFLSFIKLFLKFILSFISALSGQEFEFHSQREPKSFYRLLNYQQTEPGIWKWVNLGISKHNFKNVSSIIFFFLPKRISFYVLMTTHVHTHTLIHTHAHISMHIHKYTNIHTKTQKYPDVHTHMHIYKCT